MQSDRREDSSGGQRDRTSSIFDESATAEDTDPHDRGSGEEPQPDGGFVWPDDDPDRESASFWDVLGGYLPSNERKLGLSVLALIVLLFVSLGAGPAVAHTTFTASDVSVTGNAGQLTSLTVAPDGDVHYNGLEAEPSSVDIAVMVRLNSSDAWETVDTQSVSATGLEGSVNYSFAEIDLLSQSSLTSSDFRAADGSTSTTTVDIQVQATLVGAGPGGGDIVTTSGDTFTVSVTNEAAGGQVGGKANTGGNAA